MLCLLALSGDRADMVQERDHARDRRENRGILRDVSIDRSDAREEPATACDDRFTVDCDVIKARALRVQRSAQRADERICKYKEGGVDPAPRRSTAVLERARVDREHDEREVWDTEVSNVVALPKP
jgi:hypothetical protein